MTGKERYHANLEKNRKYGREYARKWRKKNLTRAMKDAHSKWKREVWYPRYKETARAKNNARAERFRELIRALKDVPCADCGIRYPYYVMDFDHVRGEKKYTIGQLLMGARIEILCDEVEKCDVVCANCHRERTHGKQHGAI